MRKIGRALGWIALGAFGLVGWVFAVTEIVYVEQPWVFEDYAGVGTGGPPSHFYTDIGSTVVNTIGGLVADDVMWFRVGGVEEFCFGHQGSSGNYTLAIGYDDDADGDCDEIMRFYGDGNSSEGSVWITGNLSYLMDRSSLSFSTNTQSDTIASGVLTPTGAHPTVLPQADTDPVDNLDTITANTATILWVSGSTGKTITVTESGNILVGGGGTTRTLDSPNDVLWLWHDGTNWIELSFADNG